VILGSIHTTEDIIVSARTLVASLIFVLVFAPGAIAQKPPKVTGTFTTMHTIAKSSQVTGWEFTIIKSTDGGERYFCLVQQADGEVHPPWLVQVKVRDVAIEFTIPDPVAKKTFRGHVSAKELTGKFDGETEILHLKRGKSYWQ
jgi:hypothetical protein